MTVLVPNTNISNTWDFQRRRLNQLATAMSFNAVTVNSNAAIGDAEVIGTFRANTLFTDIISGGNSSVSKVLTLTTNTAILGLLTVNNNVNILNTMSSNAVVSNTVTTGLITVGAASLTNTTITVNNHVGNWVGNTIPILRGGTGLTIVPGNGNILIGSGNGYTVGAITGEQYLSVTTGAGTISLKNLGVTTFSSNTTNTRSGNVVLTSADVTQALGFIPGAANSQLWIQVGTDLEYMSGNVAIGQTDGGAASNASLVIRSTSSLKPVVYAHNANTSANTQHAMINLGVANTGARMGIGFTSGANSANVVGGITYNGQNTLSFQTNGLESVFIDSLGNIGMGTGTPSPNKGGDGLHILDNNPGLTLQTPTQTWQMGLNPNSVAYFNGVRNLNTFALYNDNNNSGLFFMSDTGNSATVAGSFNIVLNNVNRLSVSKDGSAAFSGPLTAVGDMYSTGFQTTSDYREKYDIVTLSSDDALARIMGIRPVSFKYNNTERLREGFIAHELQEYIPVAVTGIKDGVVRQTVDKAEVVPALVKAMQVLINRVEELETRLKEVSA
jgi:hypothetical protein